MLAFVPKLRSGVIMLMNSLSLYLPFSLYKLSLSQESLCWSSIQFPRLHIICNGKFFSAIYRFCTCFCLFCVCVIGECNAMQQQQVPPWLEKLLGTAFFSVCRTHGAAARSECNMYCLDCNCDAFCFYCRSSRHKDHQVIQIRRSSYHDVVRVSEIEKALNIGGVQTYVINSARVLFLNERPQPKSGKAVSHICEICGRSLLDALRFCSLGCKVS
ncbi:putative transcription repressor PLATZ family [Helianthus annuus]|nr:putative transcription repressor PLATZ family [Helianthus annuus]